MNKILQDLYGRMERCELIIMRHQKDMIGWEVEKAKIRKEIDKLEGMKG